MGLGGTGTVLVLMESLMDDSLTTKPLANLSGAS
jgi:hypothetical protein